MEGYGQIASLELETTRAESRVAQARDEADKWEAQARQKESQSRARSGAIDLTEALLVQGVMADDLLQWLQLLATVGVTASELTENLEQYGSLEKLAQARQDQVEELEGHRLPLVRPMAWRWPWADAGVTVVLEAEAEDAVLLGASVPSAWEARAVRGTAAGVTAARREEVA
ncbi:MAG: hypothetical protein IIC50_24990 [Planctomycetes bacterium]|nr:hypothetical protein [Planctomycetota bacterium]